MRRPALLTLNAGSSSVKFSLFLVEDDTIVETPHVWGQIDGIGTAHPRWRVRRGKNPSETVALSLTGSLDQQHEDAFTHLVDWLSTHVDDVKILATGHRIVHGGARFHEPVRLTPEMVTELEQLVPLAPLHQPHNLRPIKRMLERRADWVQVGCFDTAFHTTQPKLAQMFPLPRKLFDEGIRRYGFHGLSYDYVSRRLPEVLGPERAKGRVIIAHLGNGASLCALREGKSVATTMGFTTIDGLMMGTRSGSIDPGLVLHLIEYGGMSVTQVDHMLYKESGLLGVSGISQDMRELLASDDPHAREAVELFCYRLVREIGSLAAALGGLDALVFTAGIGEHAAPVRARVAEQLRWLSAVLDPQANERTAGVAGRIDAPDSRVALAVVPTNEEAMIAHYTLEVLRREGSATIAANPPAADANR
jgi:acetate kinase